MTPFVLVLIVLVLGVHAYVLHTSLKRLAALEAVQERQRGHLEMRRAAIATMLAERPQTPRTGREKCKAVSARLRMRRQAKEHGE